MFRAILSSYFNKISNLGSGPECSSLRPARLLAVGDGAKLPATFTLRKLFLRVKLGDGRAAAFSDAPRTKGVLDVEGSV